MKLPIGGSLMSRLSWLAVAACSLPLFACAANVQPESVSERSAELGDAVDVSSADKQAAGKAHIGDSCNTDADCAGLGKHGLTAGCTNLFPGGYCTQACDTTLSNGGCPHGTFCLGGSICVVPCVNDGCADPGQVCDVLGGSSIPDKFCRDSCATASCLDGLICVDAGTFCQ